MLQAFTHKYTYNIHTVSESEWEFDVMHKTEREEHTLRSLLLFRLFVVFVDESQKK